MKLISCIIFAVFLYPQSSYSQREIDSLALVALYNSTGGQTWINNTNWLSSRPISEWYGIYMSNNRVSRVQLYSNNLSGIIPVEIGNLTNLIGLVLDNNKLTGSIPVEIGNFVNLESLYLQGNQLTGPIPKEIGNLTRLIWLYLSGNQLSGSIPIEIGNLTLLKELLLQYNLLSGSIPNEIGNLASLENLNLTHNNLSGSIPAEIGNLSNLSFSLSLYNNQLSGSIPPEIGKLTKLKCLYLWHNKLSGSIPAEISSMSCLEFLILNDNQLSGSIPKEIWNMAVLSQFQAVNNMISGQLQKEIGTTSLFILDLSNNMISGEIPPEIGNAPYLSYLFLNSNLISGSIPKEIGKLTRLIWLNLDNNKLTGSIPAEISSLVKLTKLWVSHNELVDISPFTLPVLDSLWIQNNQFTFGDIEQIINVPKKFFQYHPQDSIGAYKDTICTRGQNLTISVVCSGEHNEYQWYKDNTLLPSETSDLITISDIQLTDAGRYHCTISNTIATSLKLYSRPFDLIYSDLVERQADSLALVALYNSTGGVNWTNNTNWLSSNPLSEWHGIYLENKRVSGVELSGNNLSGIIPVEIGNLTAVKTLSLDNNSLTGTIPSEIGKLLNLESLNLDNNQLSGSIPAELSNLVKLTRLWVSHNRLIDISPFTLPVLDSLWIQNNQFTFGDIEPVINVPKKFFQYHPQDSIGAYKDTICTKGQNLTISVVCSGAHNQYQWYKDNTLLPSETSDLITISNIQSTDAGRYHCVISNTIAPDLELFARPVDLIYSNITGIPEINSSRMLLYPNPNNGKFRIESENDFLPGSILEIIGPFGKTVVNGLLKNDKIIECDLSRFSKGLYLIRIRGGLDDYEQKVIVY